MNQEPQLAIAPDSPGPCARALDLISYLYREASAAEALDFEQHMRGCASCRTELAGFGVLRESICDWREEALGGIINKQASHATGTNSATAFEPARMRPTRPRSALDAIREFFKLSPGWMRAATAFAGLAFCALAIIAFTHFFRRAEPRTASLEKPSEKVYTRQQADEMLAQAKQESDAGQEPQPLDQKSHQTQGLQSRRTEVAIASSPSTSGPTRRATPRQMRSTVPSPAPADASAAVRQGANHISPRERQQLAEVLLPQETKDEERLPRLSDLLEKDSN